MIDAVFERKIIISAPVDCVACRAACVMLVWKQVIIFGPRRQLSLCRHSGLALQLVGLLPIPGQRGSWELDRPFFFVVFHTLF